VAQGFPDEFIINGLSFDECLLLLLVCSMIGWSGSVAHHGTTLRRFTP